MIKARCMNSSVPPIVRSEDGDTPPNKFEESFEKQDHTNKESPKSLLQLFENELSSARNPTREFTYSTATMTQPAKATHDGSFSKRMFSNINRPNDCFSDNDLQHSEQGKIQSSSTDMPSSHGSVCKSIGQAVDGIEHVIIQLQKLKSDTEQDRTCQLVSHTLQLGLSAALENFCACVQTISETVQSSLADNNCDSNKDLQKLLTTTRCSKVDLVKPVTFDSGSRKNLQPQAHGQTVQANDTSKDDEVYHHGCMKLEGLPGSLNASGYSEFQDAIEASASLINASTMPLSPYRGAGLGNELTRDAPDTLSTALPPHGETPRHHPVADVLPQPREFARNSTTRSEILDFSYKAPDVPFGASHYSHSVLNSSHNDESCHGTFSQMAKLPPLHVTRPLIPAQEAGPSNDEICLGKDLKFDEDLDPLGSAAVRRPRAVGPRATIIPPRHLYETESSGQFFNRMISRGDKIAVIPGSDPACNHGNEGRATISGQSERCNPSSWLPFITDLSGNARMPRDSASFASQPLQTSVRPQGRDGTANPSTSNRITTNEDGRKGDLADSAYAIDHSDAATAGKIQECVEQLQMLGFGSNTNDGLGRLIVYAQAAEGNLSNAIDMIDEEQQVYSQM